MITFRFGHIYLNCLFSICTCVAEGLRQGLNIKRSKVRPCEIFFLFILCFCFFHLLFLVWKFDVLFVGLLVVVFFPFGNSKQTRSLLLLDLYYSAWRAICDSYHRFYSRPENLFHVM